MSSSLDSIDRLNTPHGLSPRERARAARRQAVLEAAEKVFAERGFAATTMAEIAARAGYSTGNLYNVCDGKDALFAEVVGAHVEKVLERVRKALEADAPIGEVIDRYIESSLDLVEAHRGFFVMLTQASPEFEWHGSAADGDDLRHRLDRQLESIFSRAIERGEIPEASPHSYGCILQGTLNAHLAAWVRSGGTSEDLRGPAPELRAMIRRAVSLD